MRFLCMPSFYFLSIFRALERLLKLLFVYAEVTIHNLANLTTEQAELEWTLIQLVDLNMAKPLTHILIGLCL